jgi:hypothetical protein
VRIDLNASRSSTTKLKNAEMREGTVERYAQRIKPR